MEEKYVYISSDGTKKDVREMHTEYMINALAKAHREFYNETITDEERSNYTNNIIALENELNSRQTKFLIEKLESKIEAKHNEGV